jgi:hypothetical protein
MPLTLGGRMVSVMRMAGFDIAMFVDSHVEVR